MSDLQAIATLYGQMDLHLRSLRSADDNYRAQTLYDRVAAKTGWNMYEIAVEMGMTAQSSRR